MTTIKLCDVANQFPDGMSMRDYQRLNKLIRQHGTHAKLELLLTDDPDWNQSVLHSTLKVADEHGHRLIPA